MKELLIADSGGTQTDWCFIDHLGRRQWFSTESYHPSNWNKDFIKQMKDDWRVRREMMNAELFFYGAGCFSNESASQMKKNLESCGFLVGTILSDVHGAGIAAYGRNNGWVAILGTGSVLVEWKDGEINKLIGGKGHIVGDEGSGFFFGKLVYQAYRKGNLSTEQEEQFLEKVTREDLKMMEDDMTSKYALASLSKLLSDDELFAVFHEQNILQFYESHLKDMGVNKLSLVGSYAFHQRRLIEEVLSKNGIFIHEIIRQPIERMVEQIVLNID